MTVLRSSGKKSNGSVKNGDSEKFPKIPVILPKQCILDPSNESSIISLPHPRTGRPSQFLRYNKTKLLELTEVSGPNEHTRSTPIAVQASHSARSLMFSGSNQIISDSKILVATPINPVFLILPTLYSNKTKYLTADYLEEFSEVGLPAGCESLSKELFEKCLPLVCDVLNDDNEVSFRLSTEKLVLFLNSRIEKILSDNGIPNGLYKDYVTDPLTPVDINEQDKIPQDMIDLAKRRLAVKLVSTYLSDDTIKLFMETVGLDFVKLDFHIQSIAEARAKAQETQRALLTASMPSGKSTKRGAGSIGLPERTGAGKKTTKGIRSLQKTDTSKNRSLKDMFARKSA